MNRSSGLGVFFKVSKGLAVFLESWLPAAGGEGVEEVAEPSLLDHAEFARPEGLRGRHVLGGAGLGEARDVTGGNPRAVAGGAFRALGDSAWGPLVTRSPAEGGELFLGLSWEGIPIGFVFGEHVPGDEDEFPGGGDDGDVAVFLAHDFAEEDAERPRVAVQVLGGLDEEPSCVGVAVLCDGSVVAVLGGLSGFGDEAEVGGGVVAVGESGDIAEGGEECACDGDVDAGDGHQQADLLPAVGDGGDLLVDPLELALGGLEEAQVGIDGFSSDGVEIEALEESAAVGTEEPGDGRLDQALVEDGVDAVFQACDVCDEDGAVGGESAHVTSGLVGDPDLREKAGAKELGEDQGVHFVGLDLGGGDGACAHGVGDDETRAVWGEDVGDAPGVGGGLESQGCVLAEVALGEAEECVASGGDPHTFEDPALGIEDADLGLLLVNVESDPSHGIISLVRAGPGRPGAWASAIPCGIPAGGWPMRPKRHQAGAGNESNGTYLFELAAQPGGPSGRPDTTAGSGPISVVGRPRSVRPPRTAFETAKHSVPIPVRGMRSDQGREENQEPGSLEHPPCSGAFLVSRMVDFPSWSSLSLVPGCLLEEVHTRYDYLNRLCGIYGLVEQGGALDTASWKESGLALSKKISKVLYARKGKVKLTLKEYRALLARLQGRYAHAKFLKTGVPKTLSGLSSTLTASSDEGILISQYAYTPSSQRIHRLTYEVPEYGVEESNTWWSYDQGRMAEAYNGDLSPRHTYGEGPTPGEHLFQADWSADPNNPISATHYFIQDHNNSVTQLRNASGEFEEAREYAYYGKAKKLKGDGEYTGDLGSSMSSLGFRGGECITEVFPLKHGFQSGVTYDPILGLGLLCGDLEDNKKPCEDCSGANCEWKITVSGWVAAAIVAPGGKGDLSGEGKDLVS